MDTNIQVTDNGRQVSVDGVVVKKDGAMCVQAAVQTPPSTPTTGMMVDEYNTAAELVQECREVKPLFNVSCDGKDNLIWHGSDPANHPQAFYGSKSDGTVVLLGTHPDIAKKPAAPPPGADTTTAHGTVTGPTHLTEYGYMQGGPFFEHGPAVGNNAKGQPVDEQGRAAGPEPAAAGGSELGEQFRYKFVYLDGQRYDGWGNPMPVDEIWEPGPHYATPDALFLDAREHGYPQQVDVLLLDGRHQTSSGASPSANYRQNADGSVMRL